MESWQVASLRTINAKLTNPKFRFQEKYSLKSKVIPLLVRGSAKAEKDIEHYGYLTSPTSDEAILFFTLRSWLEFLRRFHLLKQANQDKAWELPF